MTPDAEGPQLRAPSAGLAAAAATTGATAFVGGAWKSLSLLLPQLFVVLLSAVAARILGPTLMGRQSFISFVEITAIGVATIGLNTALLRTIAVAVGEGRSSEVRGLLSWAIRIVAVTGVMAGTAVASVALWAENDKVAWLLAGYVTAMGTIQTMPAAVLTGLQRWRQATFAGLCTGAVSLVVAIVVLLRGGGIAGLFAVECVVTTINAVWTGVLASKALRAISPTRTRPGDLRRRTLAFAAPSAAIMVLDLIVWKRSEFLFLAHYSSASEIAQYSIAFAAVTALSTLPMALASLVSSIATLHGAGEAERIRNGFVRSLRLLVTAVLPLTAAMVALGPLLVTSVYGQSYERAGKVLLLLMIFFPFLALQSLCDALLAGTGKRKLRVIAVALGAVVNIALGFALIPRYGAVGAALCNGGAQVVAATPIVVAAVRSQRLTWRSLRLKMLGRALLVSAGAGSAAHLAGRLTWDHTVPSVGLFAGGLVGAFAWLALARIIRVFSADDGMWLSTVMPDRLSGRAQTAIWAITQSAPRHAARGGEPADEPNSSA